MITKLIKPQNKVIRQFVQYFLFIKNENKEYEKTHICYPNTNYCLGLHKGNKFVKISDSNYKILASDNYQSYLTGIYQKPINIYCQGIFNEVCIDFEPMGLEMLTGVKISHNIFVQNVIELAFPKVFLNLYDLAFSSDDPYFCVARLEEFLLERIVAGNRLEFIPFNKIYALQMKDLKTFYNKSYRSIHRLYAESLCVSPKKFLNIQRLRRIIRQLHSVNKLTEIAHTEDFFDQAHMIKEFKNLTNLSPKSFREQSDLIDGTLCWTRF